MRTIHVLMLTMSKFFYMSSELQPMVLLKILFQEFISIHRLNTSCIYESFLDFDTGLAYDICGLKYKIWSGLLTHVVLNEVVFVCVENP